MTDTNVGNLVERENNEWVIKNRHSISTALQISDSFLFSDFDLVISDRPICPIQPSNKESSAYLLKD
ncbi:MAG: hypothetical protein EA409_03805 [Saprospirales bacterium]|nr:MAG: hypothetical protein EA409_03805 [Saprospirales bacterium]